MSLVTAYAHVQGNLRPQVQGTCGVYSFYTAVSLLRDIDGTQPTVPAPKKSEGSPGATESLRQYAKRQFQSGQGEILSEAEMTSFVKAWGYRVETSESQTDAAKKDFLTMQTRAGHPVLIAYLADQDTTGVVPVPNAASANSGAHWSLVIGTSKADALVVEPNDPGNLRTWPLAGLLLANAASDAQPFSRHYAKTKVEPNPAMQPLPAALPKNMSRSIEPVRPPTVWAPSVTPHPQAPQHYLIHRTKLYDLGGVSGTRHLHQKLRHVMIAVRPR